MGETDETKFPLLKLMMMRLKSTRRRFTRAIQKKKHDDESVVISFFLSQHTHSLNSLLSLLLHTNTTTKNVKAGASKRVLAAKQKKFNANIHKRGMVDINSSTKDKEKFTVGPVVLAFFIFVVIGSSLLQMIRTLQTGKP